MAMLDNLIKSLGIDPAQLQTMAVQLAQDAASVKEQVMAAKDGFIQAVQFFNLRLAALEESQLCIEANQQEMLSLMRTHFASKETDNEQASHSVAPARRLNGKLGAS